MLPICQVTGVSKTKNQYQIKGVSETVSKRQDVPRCIKDVSHLGAPDTEAGYAAEADYGEGKDEDDLRVHDLTEGHCTVQDRGTLHSSGVRETPHPPLCLPHMAF